ncbi:peptide/nickel transport system permease protein [Thermosporothrix hazakensis]|jgi:peptide/nickel transport system permease protein|uniref:Peptide/nickel transport system permease protein n=2 Tax=Thermosporothrix TaxID=768650 RepID=A0A326UFQ6_THEHA|nr:ABC transporter permease [Thermosporothrix hazakensis]PZW29433.1 peptide/nickel transport system permease protein [Thermosporothrix hazakensis]BBH85719.1 peptide ABC transporter permease [Thermosporothrix sp. COM3]GCE45852.1 peptide ABC transporter permease [Thermosporothrix hazakensis]
MSLGTTAPIPNQPEATAEATLKQPGRLSMRLADIRRLLTQNPKVLIGVIIVGFFVLVALIGPLLVQKDPTFSYPDKLAAPSAEHWFGTTKLGEDVFTQLIYGTRSSILWGFLTGIFVTVISVVVGLTAGYFGGLVDDIISLIINVFLVLPAFPLAVLIAAYIPFKGSITVTIVIALTSWAWGARVLRGQTLSMRKRDFIEAARSSGESSFHIIFWEILPNQLAIIAANIIGTVVYVILAEAGLEFLGLGDTTTVSWGTMFYWAQNNDALLLGAWWWFLPPGVCIALLGAGLSLINFGIDEYADPRLRRERIPKAILRKLRMLQKGQ